MTELAALVGAITFLILVVGGFVVLYYPPKLLKKFKFKDLEGEFDTERHPMENASPPAPVAESTGTAATARRASAPWTASSGTSAGALGPLARCPYRRLGVRPAAEPAPRRLPETVAVQRRSLRVYAEAAR